MILITGITGKSGKWFLKRLISENYNGLNIRVIIRSNYCAGLIDNSRLQIDKVFGDLDDIFLVNNSMKGVSTVLHIAGIHTSLNIVKAAVNNGVKRLILVHTTGIYSKYKKASTEYLDIEKRIQEIITGKDINLTILRPTMIYGSIIDQNMIIFIKMVDKLRILPVVNQAKYFLQPVHEKDLGDAYYQVLTNLSTTRNNNYILSGRQPILLMDIFKLIGKYLNKKNTFISIPFPIAYFSALILSIITIRRLDYRERVQRLVEPRVFSHNKAVKDFGYSPISFEDGLKKEVEEYLVNKKK